MVRCNNSSKMFRDASDVLEAIGVDFDKVELFSVWEEPRAKKTGEQQLKTDQF